MRTVFADTFFFLALLDSREPRHLQAAEVSRGPEFRLVKTEWVLAEFGDAYCHPKDRADFVSLYRSILNHPRFKIIPADTGLFQRGVDFFERRSDKDWSLTDCLSFVVMRDEGLREALTGDNHFEQAGFAALLK
ncbi:MAG: type II toxin-antitoxin system VapC family toxin [Verrucomicrobia bacterium]|nr:type II toxin-antitoxin system VapC family toxin [Verrucomicrobiota bacterium]